MIAPWHEFIYVGPLIHDHHAYAVYFDDGCQTAAVEHPPAQQRCPHCGAPMAGSVPARDAKDEMTNVEEPSGYMSRPKML